MAAGARCDYSFVVIDRSIDDCRRQARKLGDFVAAHAAAAPADALVVVAGDLNGDLSDPACGALLRHGGLAPHSRAPFVRRGGDRDTIRRHLATAASRCCCAASSAARASLCTHARALSLASDGERPIYEPPPS